PIVHQNNLKARINHDNRELDCARRYWSRSRRSRSITSSGLSAATRIIARTASASDTRGTSSVTAAESAHAVSCRYISGLRSRVILTGLDPIPLPPPRPPSGPPPPAPPPA